MHKEGWTQWYLRNKDFMDGATPFSHLQQKPKRTMDPVWNEQLPQNAVRVKSFGELSAGGIY